MSRAVRWRWWLAPLLYLALTVPLTWPLAAHLGTALSSWGDPQLQTWILAWDAHALATNPAAVWQAPIFYPYPDTLAYSDHHLVLSLVAAPVIWLTNNPVLAYNLLVGLSFALTGWATHDLAYALTRHRWAALIAGAAFAFCPFRIAQIFHLQLLQTAWLPWLLLAAHRLLTVPDRRWRPALLLGVFLGVQCVTALYYAFFAGLALAGYVGLWLAGRLWARWRRGAALPWPVLAWLAVSGAVALAIVVPLTLPYLRVYGTLGVVRSLRELENWSAPLNSFRSVDAGSPLLRLPGFLPNTGEWVLFPGLLALAAALLGLRRWERERWYWRGLALVAAVLALGTALRTTRGGAILPVPLPYALLYSHLPGFGALRVPARWGMLMALAVAILAALGLAQWLPRLRRWQPAVAVALLLLVVAESWAAPLRTTNPAALATVAPIYPWLGAPAQADIGVVLELPVGPIPRGSELERITWRQFNSRFHWKALAVAFSGVIPFGTTDLLAVVQQLPDQAALEYLQLVGVDTLVLHRDEYDAAQLAQVERGLAGSALVRPRATVGDAAVYTVLPAQLPAVFGTVYIDADERMPGLPVLALTRRWSTAQLIGPARLKYYGALGAVPPGQVFDWYLLASAADPSSYGLTSADRQWAAQGLSLYRRPATLRANLDLGLRGRGATHPTYPASLTISADRGTLRVNDVALRWSAPATPATLVLTVASLVTQTVTVGAAQRTVGPGTSALTATLTLLGPLQVRGDGAAPLAWLQLRAYDGAAPLPAPGPAVQASAAFAGSRLVISAATGGLAALSLRVVGAAARDDRPVPLAHGTLVADERGTVTFDLDLLHPAAAWLDGAAPAVDGRYLVYLERPGAATPGLPVATFTVSAGQIAESHAVPLPLAALP